MRYIPSLKKYMHLIVGLGNPGKEYQTTRHNVGFLAIDWMQEVWRFGDWADSKHKWLVSEGVFGGEKIILLKPLTFMNLSGESVSSLANFYKIPLENILVLSDDIDMDFGKIRYREKGSSGGQNGLKSITKHLGTEEFSRVKIGIGRDTRFETADWVLSKFKSEELAILQSDIFPQVREKIEEYLKN